MTPQAESKPVKIQAPYKFTAAEREDIATRLVRAIDDLEDLDRQFSSAKNDFKARIERVELERSIAHRLLKDGFEMRETEAIVWFHHPSHGRKTFVHAVTYQVIREEPMSADDYHRELPMEIPAPKTVEFQPKEDYTFDVVSEETGLTGEESPTACTPGGEDAGVTPVGEALAQAAILGHDDAECPVFAFNPKKFTGPKLVKGFTDGAKRAGWPVAAIDVIVTELKRCDTESQMMEIMKAHTHNPEEQP